MRTKSTILIVDDDQAGRDTLEALLVAYGYDLAFARNGPEALEQAARLRPDLILLDVMMPGMDGFEVCKRLRDMPLLAEVPVIMVTALDDQESRLRGIESGADDFISKPFNRTELRARVKTITRLNRYRHLLEERARFEWVIEQTENGFFIVDERDRIVYANHQARIYLNLPDPPHDEDRGEMSDPLLEETFLCLAQKQYQCEPQEIWETWNTDSVAPTEPQALLADQTRESLVRYLVRPETQTSLAVWLKVDTIDLPIGSQSGRLIRLCDVTEQMTTQRQMWTFHALISHKLSTPLTGIINSLHLIQDQTMNLSPEERDEFATIAFQSAHRLRKQLGDVRNYIRAPDLARPGVTCDLACLERLIAQIVTEMELSSVTITGQEQLPSIQFLLSYEAMELIFRQVLENARKFHPNHSPLVEIALSYQEPDMVSVKVSDDGVTLSPEQLVRAWVPYYQAEKGFSGEVPGMGLGLSMIATLLWNVGGKYHIGNRAQGPGVVVELLIPLQSRNQMVDEQGL